MTGVQTCALPILKWYPHATGDRATPNSNHVRDGTSPYTTPYIEMMFAAIRVHGITDQHQSKKELLVAWYREQEIDGEQISTHLAESMATLNEATV